MRERREGECIEVSRRWRRGRKGEKKNPREEVGGGDGRKREIAGRWRMSLARNTPFLPFSLLHPHHTTPHHTI